MPHFDLARLAALGNTLKTGSAAAISAALETTPVVPPDGLAIISRMKEKQTGVVGAAWQDPAKDAKTNVSQPAAAFSKLKYTNSGDMLGFIEMGLPRAPEFIGAATFDVKVNVQIASAAQVAGRIPCWWLPWLSQHIIKIKIASLATTPTIDLGGTKGSVPNPGLFFTAAINGCSVFAVGSPQNPSLYHAGITGTLEKALGNTEFTRLGGTSEAVWRNLLGRAGSAKPIGETNRGRYVAERTSATASDTDRYHPTSNPDLYTTFEALRFEATLNRRNDISAVEVTPWGAVFGVRDGAGNWSFTLVRNATVTYYHLVKKYKYFFSKPVPTAVGEKRLDTGRMNPDGSAHDLSGLDKKGKEAAYAERAYSMCVNLGHEQFFPGGGAAVYHDHNTIQII